MADVFISYSTNDRQQADMLLSELENNGIKCWIAPRDVPIGSYHAKEIPPAIDNCKVFVLLLSKHSLASDDVLREVDFATSKKKEILPFALDDSSLTTEFEYLLRTKQRYNAYPNYAMVIAEMINKIQGVLGIQPTDGIQSSYQESIETKSITKEDTSENKEEIVIEHSGIYANCPRCGSVFLITRKRYQFFMQGILFVFFMLSVFSLMSIGLYISLKLFVLHESQVFDIKDNATIFIGITFLLLTITLLLNWFSKIINKLASFGLILKSYRCQICRKRFWAVVQYNFKPVRTNSKDLISFERKKWLSELRENWRKSIISFAKNTDSDEEDEAF